MCELIAPREILLQHGFVYDKEDKRYVQDFGELSDGGEAYINDDEDFFRVEMYCFETLDGENDSYCPEHIADKNDWAMKDLEKAGIIVCTEL